MLEYIIENFRYDSQFINDIYGLNNYLSVTDLDLDEQAKILREVYDYNNKIYSIIEEDNKRLKKIISTRSNKTPKKEIPNKVKEKHSNVQTIEKLDIDVSFYMHQIRDCENLDALSQILPDKKADNYTNIINCILVGLAEEIFEFKKMLYLERKSIDDDTKRYFENEIELIKIKFEYIKSALKPETKKIVVPQTKVNKLVFLKTAYGNVCAYSDIKSIDSEYYSQFYDLLESICSGTFKNMKVFTNNVLLNGLSEVRGDATRVIFDRVGPDVYVVIHMFIKRTNRNASYAAALQNRNELYKSNYDEIKSLIDSDEYLKENEAIKAKVYGILNGSKVKKIGEING